MSEMIDLKKERDFFDTPVTAICPEDGRCIE